MARSTSARTTKTKTKSTTRTKKAKGLSWCEEGGPAIEPLAPLRVRHGHRVEFRLRLCKAPMRARIYLDGKLVTEQTGVDEIPLALPDLAVGFHLLYWNVIVPPEVEWQTMAEVKVASVPRFRRRRTHADANLTGTGWVDLDVVP